MSKRKLPPESPHWWHIIEALEHRSLQMGSDTFAAQDFTEALKAGRLRALIRRADHSRELLAASAWDDYRIRVWNWGGPPRSRMTVVSDTLDVPRGSRFYVWLPDYKNIFGDPTEKSPVVTQVQEVPKKRGRKASHPWTEIGLELARRLAKMGKVAGNRSTNSLATELEQWCEDRYKKGPANSELRTFIDGALRALRTERK